jgi:hypothetical protein
MSILDPIRIYLKKWGGALDPDPDPVKGNILSVVIFFDVRPRFFK